MPLYSYIALSKSARKIRGSMSAANEVDLEERLSVIDLDLIDLTEKKQSKGSVFGKVSIQDLIILCIHLEQLEKAGVPILDAISDLRDTVENPKLKNVLAEVFESIKGGSMLSVAFSKHPKVFNSVFVSLVEAGEKSGNLNEIFHHLAKHLKWVDLIHKKIKKAIYYPIFLLCLMSGIISLMMLFVIPKLRTFLEAQSFELPVYTKALIATSDFFASYWYTVFLTPIILIVAVKLACKFSEGFSYFIDSFKLKIPYVGATIRKIELARLCHFFAIMYRSGIGILECLDVAANIVQNKVIKDSAGVLKKSVSEGNSLTESLRVSSQFPNLVIRMFKVGEESGNLEIALENINFFYDKEVEESVNTMVGVIQPFLTIVMGGIMMWVSISVFGPLYNSFSQMNF